MHLCTQKSLRKIRQDKAYCGNVSWVVYSSAVRFTHVFVKSGPTPARQTYESGYVIDRVTCMLLVLFSCPSTVLAVKLVKQTEQRQCAEIWRLKHMVVQSKQTPSSQLHSACWEPLQHDSRQFQYKKYSMTIFLRIQAAVVAWHYRAVLVAYLD